jgi:hypothetical protein
MLLTPRFSIKEVEFGGGPSIKEVESVNKRSGIFFCRYGMLLRSRSIDLKCRTFSLSRFRIAMTPIVVEIGAF